MFNQKQNDEAIAAADKFYDKLKTLEYQSVLLQNLLMYTHNYIHKKLTKKAITKVLSAFEDFGDHYSKEKELNLILSKIAPELNAN